MIYSIEEFARFKDELPIIEDLSYYLSDIISSIEEEISSSITKHFGENEAWRTRKNPNFMLKFSAKDKIFLDINQNLNKITNLNWKTIVDVLSELINRHISETEDKPEAEATLVESLVSNILEKSIAQDIFAEYYIKCLYGLNISATVKSSIVAKVIGLIKQFFQLMETDECDNDLSKLAGLNLGQYKNIGNFFGCLYNEGIVIHSELVRALPKFIRKIADGMEWEPINKTVVEAKINLFVGFMLPTLKIIWDVVDKDTQQDLECQLKILTNHGNLPQRLKYHLMNVSDKILEARKAKMRSTIATPKISYANMATTAGAKNTVKKNTR